MPPKKLSKAQKRAASQAAGITTAQLGVALSQLQLATPGAGPSNQNPGRGVTGATKKKKKSAKAAQSKSKAATSLQVLLSGVLVQQPTGWVPDELVASADATHGFMVKAVSGTTQRHFCTFPIFGMVCEEVNVALKTWQWALTALTLTIKRKPGVGTTNGYVLVAFDTVLVTESGPRKAKLEQLENKMVIPLNFPVERKVSVSLPKGPRTKDGADTHCYIAVFGATTETGPVASIAAHGSFSISGIAKETVHMS